MSVASPLLGFSMAFPASPLPVVPISIFLVVLMSGVTGRLGELLLGASPGTAAHAPFLAHVFGPRNCFQMIGIKAGAMSAKISPEALAGMMTGVIDCESIRYASAKYHVGNPMEQPLRPEAKY